MRVFGIGISTNPWNPGLFFRGGDINHPLGSGKWFEPPFFKKVLHFYFPLPILPFLCLHVGRFGFYVGFKIYGVDAEVYKLYMNSADVYKGSQALHFSARTTAAYGSIGVKGD